MLLWTVASLPSCVCRLILRAVWHVADCWLQDFFFSSCHSFASHSWFLPAASCAPPFSYTATCTLKLPEISLFIYFCFLHSKGANKKGWSQNDPIMYLFIFFLYWLHYKSKGKWIINHSVCVCVCLCRFAFFEEWNTPEIYSQFLFWMCLFLFVFQVLLNLIKAPPQVSTSSPASTLVVLCVQFLYKTTPNLFFR